MRCSAASAPPSCACWRSCCCRTPSTARPRSSPSCRRSRRARSRSRTHCARTGSSPTCSAPATSRSARSPTGRFDWERALRQLSLAIPRNVYLLNVAATGSPDVEIDGGGGGGDLSNLRNKTDAPAFVMTGCTYSQHAVARMMTRMRNLDDVTEVKLAKSARKEDSTETPPARPRPPRRASRSEDVSDCVGSSRVTKFDLLVEFGGSPTAAAAAAAAAEPRLRLPVAAAVARRAGCCADHRACGRHAMSNMTRRDRYILIACRDRRSAGRVLVHGALAQAQGCRAARQGHRGRAAAARPGQAGEGHLRAGTAFVPADVREPRAPGQGRPAGRGRALAARAAEPRCGGRRTSTSAPSS